jgi:radical SAM superfamily enzyme YgiQ (UPF0313 family)
VNRPDNGKTVKVLLVNPGNGSWASIHPPMHLGTIAAFIAREGVDVRISDQTAGHDVHGDIRKFDPDIVGITATTPLAPSAYEIARMARGMGKLTVMGGKHATIMHEEALQHVDIVVRFEGEQAMLDIVRGARDRIIERPFIKNLDDIPPPAWHLMEMAFYLTAPDRLPRTHLNFIPPHTKTASLMTIRGCPYKCIFCYNSWSNTPVRFHSPERVIRDIKELIEKYDIGAVFFMDDDLFCKKAHIQGICELIVQEKLPIIWGCQAISKHVTEESLRLAKQAGLRQVGFGFESGSPRILSMLKNSRTTVEENAAALHICRNVGIRSFSSYMVGSPTETLEDIKMTADFIRNNPVDDIGVLITTPYPGTRLWDICRERGIIPENIDWRQFTTGAPTIPLCENISMKDLARIRDELEFMVRPMQLGQMLHRVLADPMVLCQALRNPDRLWRALKSVIIKSR